MCCSVELHAAHSNFFRSLAWNTKAYGTTDNKEEESWFLGTIFSLVCIENQPPDQILSWHRKASF